VYLYYVIVTAAVRRSAALVLLGLLAQIGPLGPSLHPDCLAHSGIVAHANAEAPASGVDHGTSHHTPPPADHAGMDAAGAHHGATPTDSSNCCSGLCRCDLAATLPAFPVVVALAATDPPTIDLAAEPVVVRPRTRQVVLPFPNGPPA